VGFAKHSETTEDMIIYKALYGDGGTWIRPLSMWSEPVDADTGKVKRFEFISNAPKTYTQKELHEAIRSNSSTLRKCEKAITTLKFRSSSYTLMKRRIEALNIAIALIEGELRNTSGANDPENGLTLRPFFDNDIPLMERWLYEPYVAQWYKHPDHWLRELRERHGEFAYISHFIVQFRSQAIGFCQYYDCFHSQQHEIWNDDWKGGDKQGEVFSIDYLIGEPEYLRRGLGAKIVTELISKLKAIGAKKCVVSPEPENIASNRVLEVNGFILNNEVYLLEL
jgi:RimJ/RimL family protein N-acetyltransferase